MKRRTAIRTLASAGAVGTVGLAGCLGHVDSLYSGGGSGSSIEPNPGDETDAPTPTPPDADMDGDSQLVDIDLKRIECADLAITFCEDTVEVVGCVRGNNGCHRPELAHATVEGDTFTVVVASVDRSGPDEFCTQAIVHNGYKVTAEFEALPDAVEVVHDDMDGRRTVKTTER